MTTDVVTAAPDTPVSEILGLMRSHDIHEVPLVNRGALVGVVTLGAIARRGSPQSQTKAETLIAPLPKLDPDDTIPNAASTIITAGVRGAPVVERRRLVGMLTRTDLVRAFRGDDTLAAQEVRAVMTPTPQTVREDQTVVEARKLMASLDERSVPVVDAKGRLTGIIGLKDLRELFMALPGRGSPGDLRGERDAVKVEVKGVMNYPPITCRPQATLREAADLMLEHGISSVVVVEGDEPVGILTKMDLVELLASTREEEQVLVQITGLDEQPDVYEGMYDVVQKSMKRLSGIVTPRLLNLHVVQHKAEGDNSKYSIRARLQTEHGMYYQNHHDWELMAALHGLLEALEQRIKAEKDRRVSDRRRQTSPASR